MAAVGPVGAGMVDLAVLGRCGAAGSGAATVFGMTVEAMHTCSCDSPGKYTFIPSL